MWRTIIGMLLWALLFGLAWACGAAAVYVAAGVL